MCELPLPLLPVAEMLTFGAMSFAAISIVFAAFRQRNGGNFIHTVMRRSSPFLYVVAVFYMMGVVLGLVFVYGLADTKVLAFWSIFIGSIGTMSVMVGAPFFSFMQIRISGQAQPGFKKLGPLELIIQELRIINRTLGPLEDQIVGELKTIQETLQPNAASSLGGDASPST